MTDDGWSPGELEAAAQTLMSGRNATSLPPTIRALLDDGMTLRHAATVLHALSTERRATHAAADRCKLVWTGPIADAQALRLTSVVVSELFASAKSSVLVASYAIHQGSAIFLPLHQAQNAKPGLRIRLFLNVARERDDARDASEIVRAFERDLATQWPWTPRPEVYFDPRALELDAAGRPSLHAKCVVVDDRRALVTSANLTEAAQERNLELGVLLDDPEKALRIRALFDGLVERDRLRRLPGY